MNRISALVATAAISTAAHAGGELQGELAKLEPLVGVWTIDATWTGGTPLVGVAEWKPVLGGAWLQAETYVQEPGPDGASRLYHRYTSFIGWDSKAKGYTAWSFANGGYVTNEPVNVNIVDGRPGLSSEFAMGETLVRDRTQIDAEGNLTWNVWTKRPAQDDWAPVMSDQWERGQASDFEEAASKVGAPELTGAAETLAPFQGHWEIDAEWTIGGSLKGTQHNFATLGGSFLMSEVDVSDDGGPVYNRYRTVWAPEADGSVSIYTFQHTGGVVAATVTTEEVDGRTEYRVVNADDATPMELMQTLVFDGPDAFDWKVQARPNGGDQWNTMMDDQWTRVAEDEDYREGKPVSSLKPIDPAAFDASGAGVRSFTKSRTFNTDRATAYCAFTDGDFFPTAYAPDRPELAANIDLAIGGRYEWLWDGKVGSNGCQVLSYIPGRMVSFTWNSPPSHATRDRHTWVVVEFADADVGTEITLTHLGFGEGSAWDETHDYFQKAWDVVLENFEKNLESGDHASS